MYPSEFITRHSKKYIYRKNVSIQKTLDRGIPAPTMGSLSFLLRGF